ncbi:hypothetical protein [Streptomyces rubrogriseus]|nr:hypothetical protein [Streptomyces rubrogriseus]
MTWVNARTWDFFGLGWFHRGSPLDLVRSWCMPSPLSTRSCLELLRSTALIIKFVLMDAGLAAVCGALAGALGAVGAAWATSRAQWKSARLTVRAEHLRQRHDNRAAHYKTLLSAVSDLQGALNGGSYFPGNELHRFTEEYCDAVETCVKKLRDAVENVALFGPREPRDLAIRIFRTAEITMWAVFELGSINSASGVTYPEPEDVRRSLTTVRSGKDNLSELLDAFSESARVALDDDGTGLS